MKGLRIGSNELRLPDIWNIMRFPNVTRSTWAVINEFDNDERKEEMLPNGYPDFRHITKITIDEISEVFWEDIEYV